MSIPGIDETQARKNEETPEILFVSLGMFILDTIVTPTGETLSDIIGGAGTFSALGARLFSTPKSVGFVVDYGTDTPPHIETEIERMGFNLVVHRHSDRPGTRGLNTYRGDIRDFQYLTPKIRVEVNQLPLEFLKSKSFHLICAADRYRSLNEQLKRRRHENGYVKQFLTIWEPVPDACVPSARKAFETAWRECTVISPNMDEAASILDVAIHDLQETQKRRKVEEMAREMYECGAKVIVIRCSAMGAYLYSKDKFGWFPAFWTSPENVVDATGGGNTFCGAFVVALAQGKSCGEAMGYGAVAAALAIQQVGLPGRRTLQDNSELWNGREVVEMLSQYQARLAEQ